MRNQYRKDITALKALYWAFRASESFYEDDYAISAYRAFYDRLHALSVKYKTTPRQIAYALTV